MKHFFLLLLLVKLIVPFSYAQNKILESFPLQDVRLLPGPFKHAESINLKYVLSLNPDRLLAPYLKEAGLPPKAEGYGNWESTGLDGHTLGHYLTALALLSASTGDIDVQKKLNYTISELEECQKANGNGYVGGIPDGKKMWQEVAAGKLNIDNFSVNKRWVPWYNIHKLYAGLRDAYLIAGNLQAKDILIKLTDWSLNLVSNLTDDQIQNMLRCEHGGMNEVFADVAAITGDKKYLELAKRFTHKIILDPLIQHQDKLNGIHANTQIPKVIGFERISELSGDTTWRSASAFFWETVVNNRSVTIGGNSVREHFHPANNFSSMISDKEGPETCNTYNMLKLSKQLYFTSCSLKYIDYYERALYNHILSSQHPEHGGLVYFTPMRPGHYRVYSQPQQCFWCCVGSGMENHGKYGELIYAHKANDIYVNLFIPSTLTWKEKGLILTQNTAFPDEETVSISLQLKKSASFALLLRYPEWIEKGAMKITINGKDVPVTALPQSYISINRKWKTGDKLDLKLPMHTKTVQLPDNSNYFSFVHGPIVLAAKTDTNQMVGLIADDSRMGHVANGPLVPLENAPVIVSDNKNFADKIMPVSGKSLTFTAENLISPDKFKNLEMIPFFRVHDSRYIVYWQYSTPEDIQRMKDELRKTEEKRLALEAITIDQVAPGEQQPESDHNFQSDKTETGVHKDRHWRHAAGWFSYDLKDKNKEAVKLQITYFGRDGNRNFDILLNNNLLAAVSLDGSHGDNFVTVDYAIPKEIISSAQNNLLVVKFKAHEGSLAGGIYYVRLLRK